MPTTVHITDKADQIISGIKDFSQGLSINNNYLFYSQPSGFFSGVGISGSGDGGYFIGKTKLSQNTLILKDESFGKNSVAEDSIRNWQSVAISANGQYQTAVTNIAGFIYVSNDYGDTWRQKASALSWFRIAMSADGKYQTASTYNTPFGFIYTSDNYGQTWTQLPTQETSIQGIAMSSDGKVQIFVTYTTSEYKISKDYGKTWTNGTVVSASGVKGVAISNDGKYITIVGAGSSDRIYISSNYGSSWTTIGSIGTWNSVAMSSDGKFQAAARGGTGFIYISNNYGNTWSIKNNSGSRLWLSISMSSDGKYIAATTDGTYNYVSYDYGENWTVSYINNRIAGSSATCYDIDVSSDGKYMLTAAQGGYIYLSKTEEKVNGNLYADNLIYNTGNQTISGVKTFANSGIFNSGLNVVSGNLTVGGTGVLLSGQNCFIMQASTSQSNFTDANKMYFFMGHGAGYSASRLERPTPFLEACTVKKVSFQLNQAAAAVVANNVTGFFINTTKNLTGIIFSNVSTANDGNFYHYTNNNLNMPFSEGDSGVFAVYTTTAGSTNVRSIATLYCYN